MGGHLRLTGQYHLSLSALGGWTPLRGHLRLTGQSHLSLTPLRRLDPYGGTFDIDWSISFVPSPLGG